MSGLGLLEGFMPRIKQLPPLVITKIAAGEVIERPASVVKELLENSVDAQSTRIDIDIEQGGAELIQIVDNGCGIVSEDLPLAFASHATSKLTTADDLFQISTLGFRGEALASVGGIAQVTLQSRPHDQVAGAEVSCQGGVLSPVRDWNGAPGTRIEVRHLFFNTPVRRRFLRAAATEMGHIAEAFTRLALARPALHLTLRHNGKAVYEVPGSAGLLERIGLFFGAEVRDKVYPVECRQGPATLHGFIADPSCERGNAKMQYLFLNSRWVRDRSLGHALQEAYRGLLMTGRYATAFLFLDLPADQVDVNVHPTKAEVRFRDGQALYSFVFATIRNRLREENLTARLRPTSTLAQPQVQEQGGQGPGWLQPRVEEASRSLFAQTGFPAVTIASRPANGTEASPAPAEVGRTGNPTHDSAAVSSTSSPLARAEQTSPAEAGASTAGNGPPPPTFKAIQLYNAYLVLETPEGMLVIDQHALHERILFEHLKHRIREGTLETQRLLVPEPVELTAEQAARTLEHKAALAELGLGVEDFGGGTVLLTSYPAILGKRSPADALKNVVDFLSAKDRLPTREQLFNDLLSLMACHAAVRAGDALSPEEITALVALRGLAEDTHHCPHGRPTSLLFSKHDLDRQFRRV
jgi:DNA mismatch repair protein MutL